MYQLFVEPGQIDVENRRVVIEGGDVNHIKNVLRMKAGEEIAVNNGQDGREYRCGIVSLHEDRIICQLRFIKEDSVELPVKVYLFQGLPKGDKMELVIQKAVELGVHAIIPVAAKRCVVRLDEKKARAKVLRWQGIAQAAAKQSKRRIIPEISFGRQLAKVLVQGTLSRGLVGSTLALFCCLNWQSLSSFNASRQFSHFGGGKDGFTSLTVQNCYLPFRELLLELVIAQQPF